MQDVTGIRFLVAGGSGFIGSYICERLLARGATVVCVDNLCSSSRRNIAPLEGMPGFTFLDHDVCDPLPVEADAVFNLACRASPPRYQADPLHTFYTCVTGTQNAIDVALKSGGRLVQASTSEVYGDPEVHPQSESYRGSVNPIGPRACYDEGKRAAETLLFDHHRAKGLRIGVARIFNTYGPRMDPFDGRVVSNFVRQALLGEPLTIYGDGSQTRAFCYVDDLVEGLLRLMDADDAVTGPINLGDPTERTILELAETVRDLVGGQVEIVFRPLPQDDPMRRKPDISRAKRELDWSPGVPLAEGLRKTIDYIHDLITTGVLDDYRAADLRRFPPAE